jgi:hypothetical protein
MEIVIVYYACCPDASSKISVRSPALAGEGVDVRTLGQKKLHERSVPCLYCFLQCCPSATAKSRSVNVCASIEQESHDFDFVLFRCYLERCRLGVIFDILTYRSLDGGYLFLFDDSLGSAYRFGLRGFMRVAFQCRLRERRALCTDTR